MDTGRLWDDHFGHLGYQPKFYRVQDAIFTNSLNYGNHFWPIFQKNIKNVLFWKSHLQKKKGPCQERTKPNSERVSTHTPIFLQKYQKNIKNDHNYYTSYYIILP